MRTSFDWTVCNGCYVDVRREDEREREAKDYNQNIIKQSIGQASRVINYDAYIDTMYEAPINITKNLKLDKLKMIITPRPAGSYIDYIGYLVPRKPSEEDFVKWYKNK